MKNNNEAFYYPHYANMSNTVIGIKIRRKLGNEGYGVYILFKEKLLVAKDRKIKEVDLEDVAFEIRTDTKVLMDLIEIGALTKQDEYVFCNELNESLNLFDKKQKAHSEGGKKAAENLTPQQRKERGKKAIQTRWQGKDSTQDSINDTPSTDSTQDSTNDTASKDNTKDTTNIDTINDTTSTDSTEEKLITFKSKYFGKANTSKLINAYNNSTLVDLITYNQYEVLFIYTYHKISLSKEETKHYANRDYLINVTMNDAQTFEQLIKFIDSIQLENINKIVDSKKTEEIIYTIKPYEL